MREVNQHDFALYDEKVQNEAAAEEADPVQWNVQNLANNGLELSYQGCQIRIRKARGRSIPRPTSATQRGFYMQELLDFGEEGSGSVMNLLILWRVDSSSQLLGLDLVKPTSNEPVVRMPYRTPLS